MKTIKSIFYTGQCVFSALVIIAGLFYGIRCLFAGQIFCAMCFFAGFCINGYINFWCTSIREYRAHRAAVKNITQ